MNGWWLFATVLAYLVGAAGLVWLTKTKLINTRWRVGVIAGAVVAVVAANTVSYYLPEAGTPEWITADDAAAQFGLST
jgi:hypothetical protein